MPDIGDDGAEGTVRGAARRSGVLPLLSCCALGTAPPGDVCERESFSIEIPIIGGAQPSRPSGRRNTDQFDGNFDGERFDRDGGNIETMRTTDRLLEPFFHIVIVNKIINYDWKRPSKPAPGDNTERSGCREQS